MDHQAECLGHVDSSYMIMNHNHHHNNLTSSLGMEHQHLFLKLYIQAFSLTLQQST